MVFPQSQMLVPFSAWCQDFSRDGYGKVYELVGTSPLCHQSPESACPLGRWWITSGPCLFFPSFHSPLMPSCCYWDMRQLLCNDLCFPFSLYPKSSSPQCCTSSFTPVITQTRYYGVSAVIFMPDVGFWEASVLSGLLQIFMSLSLCTLAILMHWKSFSYAWSSWVEAREPLSPNLLYKLLLIPSLLQPIW